MVNAFEALLQSPMLFRATGNYFLNGGFGHPFEGEETAVDSRGREVARRQEANEIYYSLAWALRADHNRYYHGRVDSLTEISNLKIENGVYTFTVNYREFEVRLGTRGGVSNRYGHLSNNANLYCENFFAETYSDVLKKHFPNMPNQDSLNDLISGNDNRGVRSETLSPRTLEEVFGPGVSASNFLNAQEELCRRLGEFYNRDSHKPRNFEAGGVKVEKWRHSSATNGMFHFQTTRSDEFTVSLRVKFAKEMLVSPRLSHRSMRVDSYENGRSNMLGYATLKSIFYKVTLPDVFPEFPQTGYSTRDWAPSMNNSNTDSYSVKVLSLGTSGTKARPKRGAWQGPYTGLSKFTSKVRESNRTYLEYVSEYGMPNCEPSIKDFKKLICSPPTLSEELWYDILTPTVDISPIELGHVNLYRLGNPMYELKGTHLNEYLVPSTKDFILSLSNEKVLSIDPDNRVECVGNDVTCKEIEQATVAAGSYLVKVKKFCNRHHDSNRTEYNSGLGSIVNLMITTRNVLREIKVHDGQTREDTVEFVGTGEIATDISNFDSFDERW